MENGEAGRVFISYRRQETAWPARQLYDLLVTELGADRVFKDVDNIEPGDDFVERIQWAVGSCQVLLALIGPQWLTVKDAAGGRRLDDPTDFVRLEVETALNRDDVRVIPILVDNAKMPTPQELPTGVGGLDPSTGGRDQPGQLRHSSTFEGAERHVERRPPRGSGAGNIRCRRRDPAPGDNTSSTSGRISSHSLDGR